MAEVSRGLARFRIILWSLVAVVAIGATAIYALSVSGVLPFRPANVPGSFPTAPFTLESTKGGEFTLADLKGEPSLVFFGYTLCPNVCPTTMADTVEWKKRLGYGPDQLRTIFVTVDPDRDTKQVVADYTGAFDPSIIGLVGDEKQTEAAKTSFGAFSEKAAPDASGFYLVNHTASVFLIDKNGQYFASVDYQESTDTAIAKIKRMVEGS